MVTKVLHSYHSVTSVTVSLWCHHRVTVLSQGHSVTTALHGYHSVAWLPQCNKHYNVTTVLLQRYMDTTSLPELQYRFSVTTVTVSLQCYQSYRIATVLLTSRYLFGS